MRFQIIHIILLAMLVSCKSSSDKRKTDENISIELNDSFKLIHIKNLFYKKYSGHLYQKTLAQNFKSDIDTVKFIEYFNGEIPQYIDPLTFQELEGWYAKDKNFAYEYRPTSGGMLIVKLDSADIKSFDILQGHYDYAFDNKHVYHESKLLKNIRPDNLKMTTDENGFVTKIVSGKTVYEHNKIVYIP